MVHAQFEPALANLRRSGKPRGQIDGFYLLTIQDLFDFRRLVCQLLPELVAAPIFGADAGFAGINFLYPVFSLQFAPNAFSIVRESLDKDLLFDYASGRYLLPDATVILKPGPLVTSFSGQRQLNHAGLGQNRRGQKSDFNCLESRSVLIGWDADGFG